jgi:hypothetical protein
VQGGIELQPVLGVLHQPVPFLAHLTAIKFLYQCIAHSFPHVGKVVRKVIRQVEQPDVGVTRQEKLKVRGRGKTRVPSHDFNIYSQVPATEALVILFRTWSCVAAYKENLLT